MSNIYDEWKDYLSSQTSQNLVPSAPLARVSAPKTVIRNIDVRKVDNILPEEMYDTLLKVSKIALFRSDWVSTKEDEYTHWNSNFVSNERMRNLANAENRVHNSVVKNAWLWIKENIPEFKDQILIRVYMNAYGYGSEGYFHKDSEDNYKKTMVLYLVDDHWDKNWAGETIFTNDEDEIVFSSLPKKNRAVIFNANLPHCARSVSRACRHIRKVLVFKTRNRLSDNFEKLSEFLVKNRADGIAHAENSSLHDHLMRCFMLLEKKNAPEHVCIAAGLHSVFGTNIFTDPIFKLADKDIIVSEFGEKAFELAALFSIIDRPSTLETPEGFEDGKYHIKMNNGNTVAMDEETFNELRLIEGANLTDQETLDKEKYPNIYEYYTNYHQNV